MASMVTGTARTMLSVFVALLLALLLFNVARSQGWLSPLGIRSTSSDSQVVQAIQRTEEVSLLSLGIQGIQETEKCREVFGGCLPGSGEKAFLQYNFTAKLGVDGSDVDVEKTGKAFYRISVPEFIQIGFAKPTFKVAVEDGGPLRFVTPDIEQDKVISEILDDDAQAKYIESNKDLLKDQTQFFYDSLIKSVDPNASTTYEFAS